LNPAGQERWSIAAAVAPRRGLFKMSINEWGSHPTYQAHTVWYFCRNSAATAIISPAAVLGSGDRPSAPNVADRQ